jgi:hypothetical protein
MYLHEKSMEKNFQIKKLIIAKMIVQCKQRYTRTIAAIQK